MDDLLIYNAKIYSLEKEGEIFSAMRIKDGKITCLYEGDPLESEHSSIVKQVFNAENQAILPGLIDSHLHFIMTAGMKVLSTPVSAYTDGSFSPTTLNGVKKLVSRIASNTAKSKPLIFNNYIIPTFEEGRLPYKEELDAWAPNRLVLVMAIDGHSFALSTQGLVKLGINPEGHNGILTEDMEEFDLDKTVELFTNSLTLNIILEGIQKTVNDAISLGLVGLHCLDGLQNDVSKDISLKFMKLLGPKIPLKLRLYPQIRNVKSLKPFYRKMRSPRIGGCLTWDIDGAVGAKTAAFDKPYIGEPDNYGSLLLTKEEVIPLIREAHLEGSQVTSHAIGSVAIDVLIDAYKTVLKEFGDVSNTLRHRIDHFEFPTKDAINKAIKELNLIVVPQPGFNWIDANYPGMDTYKKYLDPEIVQRQNPLRSIIDAGGIICGSTDSPIQSIDPWLQIHGMVNFPIESQRISIYEALRTYTYNGAYATFEEKERGTISIGKWADFIMVDNDPFQIDTNDIMNITVNATYINGKKMIKSHNKPIKYLLKLLFNRSKSI